MPSVDKGDVAAEWGGKSEKAVLQITVQNCPHAIS